MVFVDKSEYTDLRDHVIQIELRMLEMEATLEKQEAIINALCDKIERWSALKRIV